MVLVWAAVYPLNAFRLSIAANPIFLRGRRPGQADNRQLRCGRTPDRPERASSRWRHPPPGCAGRRGDVRSESRDGKARSIDRGINGREDVWGRPMAEWGLGTQLRAIRLDRGLTLEQLAEASGVSVRGISDIERGVRDRPRRSTIDALCDALRVDAGTRRELAREQSRRTRAESPAESVQPHRVRDFVGRDAEFRAIAEHLAGAAHDGVPRTVIVAG